MLAEQGKMLNSVEPWTMSRTAESKNRCHQAIRSRRPLASRRAEKKHQANSFRAACSGIGEAELKSLGEQTKARALI